MEMAEGGELFESIVQHGRYTEKQAADYFRYVNPGSGCTFYDNSAEARAYTCTQSEFMR